MTGSVILLNLLAAVALLLWATRMVRTGVERAFSTPLRRAVRHSANNRFLAAATGMMVAVSLQSSTAVALILSGFATSGLISTTVGLTMMLGADLGSALVVQLLSLDLSLMVPICLIIGTVAFLNGQSKKVRQLGRIIMGIGLILISLNMIAGATAPLRESALLPVIVEYLTGDMVTAFLVAAAFTWLIHSSVAMVLLIMAFALQGVVPFSLALVLVLGANVGSGLIAANLTRKAEPGARSIPLGNAIFRTVMALIMLLVLATVELPYHLLGPRPEVHVANFHLLFNGVLALLGLPFVGFIGRGVHGFLVAHAPSDPEDRLHGDISALDPDVLNTPRLALASATREVLQMSKTIETMLAGIMPLFDSGDKEAMRQLSQMDDEVDRYHSEIKHYLADLTRVEFTPEEAFRCQELTSACIKLEHIGDIIVRNLLKHVQKKSRRGVQFSAEGWRELTELHARVVSNTQLALNILISGDMETARQLILEKEQLRMLEARSNERHLERLSSGDIKSVESSEIHLDTVRDLKQINSALASFAYPVLERAGELHHSRLVQRNPGK